MGGRLAAPVNEVSLVVAVMGNKAVHLSILVTSASNNEVIT